MFTLLEKFIAFRYLRARRVEGFISMSAWFSLIGIIIGVATLIVVMSVMNGFRSELVNRILGINGHLMIYSKNDVYIKNYNNVIKEILDIKNVISVIPSIEGQALARSKDYISGSMIRGIRWSDLPSKSLLWKNLSKETKTNFKNKQNVIIGYRLAKKLNVHIGQKLTLFSANGIETAFGVIPQKQTFIVGGFFNVGMYEYDSNLIFLPWKKAQSFLRSEKNAHNIEIFLNNHNKSNIVKDEIEKNLNKKLHILDWKRKNKTFINALNVEKNVMFLILSLIIIVAAFNIISSMVMLVNAKKLDIALLRTMGATKISIIKIFLVIGISIGALGTLIGTLLGIYLSINIEKVRQVISYILNQTLFSPKVYFLNYMPSEINFYEVFSVASTSLLITILASAYPAWKASKILPAEILRYE